MDKNIRELVLNRFIWTRTNTVELFEIAKNANILQFKPKYLIENSAENHNLLYQFQCILTSTDTHFRRLKKDANTRFGIYVKEGKIAKKQEIRKESVLQLLEEQVKEAKNLISNGHDLTELISAFFTIEEHESLHQGQLIVMFRETKTEFPDEFKTAWNL